MKNLQADDKMEEQQVTTKEPQQVTTKDPKKVEVGRHLAAHNPKKTELKEQSRVKSKGPEGTLRHWDCYSCGGDRWPWLLHLPIQESSATFIPTTSSASSAKAQREHYGTGAVIAVGVIGGLGYYIYQSKKSQQPLLPQSPQPPQQWAVRPPRPQSNKFEMD